MTRRYKSKPLGNGKRTLILDMDGVVINTNKAICELYNQYFHQCTGYVAAMYNDVYHWNYKEQCKLADKRLIDHWFSSVELWDYMELSENANMVINKLRSRYYIKLYTIGSIQNIKNKCEWLEKTGYNTLFDEMIFKVNIGEKMDKSDFNMDKAIFVDDNLSNLESSNAAIKICYSEGSKGGIKEYNKKWKGYRVDSMDKLYDMLDRDIINLYQYSR